mmetsp:Transcript_16361/g.18515  ORF Transcript_16361/g.18515 Transcript_16361/m.18515 type:complete len:83 (-) Transcript_16361:52-300(-)
MFDRVTGLPKCLMNATFLTAIRTAAGSALATSLFARLESSSLLVFGAGLQAEAHVLAISRIRDITANCTSAATAESHNRPAN